MPKNNPRKNFFQEKTPFAFAFFSALGFFVVLVDFLFWRFSDELWETSEFGISSVSETDSGSYFFFTSVSGSRNIYSSSKSVVSFVSGIVISGSSSCNLSDRRNGGRASAVSFSTGFASSGWTAAGSDFNSSPISSASVTRSGWDIVSFSSEKLSVLFWKEELKSIGKGSKGKRVRNNGFLFSLACPVTRYAFSVFLSEDRGIVLLGSSKEYPSFSDSSWYPKSTVVITGGL